MENEVRKKVMGAGMSSSLVLRNQLPDLLDDIAEILIEKQRDGYNLEFEDSQRTVEKNKHHGKLRAETENYTIDQVIQEYFVLHRIITELLKKHEVLTGNIPNLLGSIFERTILHSSSSFSESIQEVQDKLVGTLTHDLRNPLTTALSAIELMAQRADGNEELIDLARKGVIRSISLAEGLLDTISVKSGEGMMMHFSEADYVEIMKVCCNEASRAYGKEIICKVPDAVRGVMDMSAVRRLIDNLISNAVKYGDKSSAIEAVLQDGETEVVLMIRNQGHPISPGKKKFIFNFLSGNKNETSNKKSWGMGLTLVKLITDAHEGSIHLTSTREEGTTFRVTLNKNLKHSGKIRMKLS